VYLFLKVILKRCLTPTVDRRFFKTFRRQAPVNVNAKIITKFRETGSLKKVARNMVKPFDKCIEMNGHNFQHLQ
jgi:hypothetical protein